MVESALKEAFQSIFAVSKVSFAEPGESAEQQCLFIEIENSVPTIKDGRELQKVTGNAVMIAQNDKLPLGFFAKAIKKAGAAANDFFFFEVETNTRRTGNIVARGFSFVYFFDSQFDPDIANIESADVNVVEG